MPRMSLMGITQEVEGAVKKTWLYNFVKNVFFAQKSSLFLTIAKAGVSLEAVNHSKEIIFCKVSVCFSQYPMLGCVRPWSNRVRVCFHNIIYIATPIEAQQQQLQKFGGKKHNIIYVLVVTAYQMSLWKCWCQNDTFILFQMFLNIQNVIAWDFSSKQIFPNKYVGTLVKFSVWWCNM